MFGFKERLPDNAGYNAGYESNSSEEGLKTDEIVDYVCFHDWLVKNYESNNSKQSELPADDPSAPWNFKKRVDMLDGKCNLCKSRERYTKGEYEYCGGCGTMTAMNVNSAAVIHRLRCYVDYDSPTITDAELDEVESKMDFDECLNEEFSGNFIFTKNLVDREVAVESMCCGIITKDIELANGETIYFAFDYGH